MAIQTEGKFGLQEPGALRNGDKVLVLSWLAWAVAIHTLGGRITRDDPWHEVLWAAQAGINAARDDMANLRRRNSGSYAYGEEKRDMIAALYLDLKANSEIEDQEAWAEDRWHISGKTLRRYVAAFLAKTRPPT